MPVFTLITSAQYFPPDPPDNLTVDQKATVSFGKELHNAVFHRKSELLLDPETPQNGVVILHRKASHYDVNSTAMWVIAQFSEEAPDNDVQYQVRDQLREIIEDLWNPQDLVSLALDCFWGPSRGFFTFKDKTTVW